MKAELFLSLYAGGLFLLVLVVAPVLLRAEEKNIAGRFYGRILWRFYPIAFLLLMVYLILTDEKLYGFVLLMGLGLNAGLSYLLKKYKRENLPNIDLFDYNDPKRRLFRRLSLLSTFLFFANMFFAIVLLTKTLGG
ncbi:MAG: hypothetical protein D6699_01265 [Aquificota bacterium]|nr:MAG: hypothetical protein D6699_01265 [Aquificota bacterium]